MKRGRKEKIYALYKGEELLADGTLREISAKMGVKIRTLYFLSSPAYKKRCRSKNCREVICLD